jgi:hypothetical protein
MPSSWIDASCDRGVWILRGQNHPWPVAHLAATRPAGAFCLCAFVPFPARRTSRGAATGRAGIIPSGACVSMPRAHCPLELQGVRLRAKEGRGFMSNGR